MRGTRIPDLLTKCGAGKSESLRDRHDCQQFFILAPESAAKLNQSPSFVLLRMHLASSRAVSEAIRACNGWKILAIVVLSVRVIIDGVAEVYHSLVVNILPDPAEPIQFLRKDHQ